MLLMDTDLSPEQREYVEHIHSASQVLLETLNEFLATHS